ncbi:hypothetical protein [Thalassospira sp.]|uniref:hypothetical protein n=1 Tax=Thalassospira sp. TaxID=1912094 RepID=UPI0027338386|nr:hypothetical protein [Thalassospira sp.]MDP2699245.1 hypothetical protein [Thalassospira sp.]
MPASLHLKLILQNDSNDPLSLTALAPQDGWQDAPPRHLAPGDVVPCYIIANDELAITLHYGAHHVELHLGDGTVRVDPGNTILTGQKLDGQNAEITLAFRP